MATLAPTDERIIAAAERLFSEGGEEATSMRAVTREAGVNVAAIHYHFGGRDGLMRQILDRKIGPLNARRFDLLNAALAEHGDQVPLESLLAAFLLPDLELLDDLRRRDLNAARFLGRSYTQPSDVVAGFLDQQFGKVAARFLPLFRRELPNVSEIDLAVRLRVMVSAVTVLFATATPIQEPGDLGEGTIDIRLDRLVRFFAAGFRAPSAADWR